MVDLYYIQVDSTNKNLRFDEQYTYKLSMQLYEDLCREIKGGDVYIEINKKGIFVPSLDTKAIYEDRIDFINNFMKNKFKGVLMGNLDSLKDKIYKSCIKNNHI